MRKRLYPSSAAFMWGETVLTEYDSGCLRSILLSAHGVRGEIPKAYMEVGAAHEDWYEKQLAANPKVEHYAREVEVKQAIPGFDEVTYSGRIDVLVNARTSPVIVETKGTISKNTRLSVIRKGKVKLNQLAQLVSYMIAKEIPRGRLVVGYYEVDDQDKYAHCEGREFKVAFDDDGLILVDGIPSGFSVLDALAHRNAAAITLTTNTVGNRPDKWDQKFGGPCTHCTFKDVCTKYDAGEIDGTEGFIAAGRDAIRRVEAKPDPQPNRIKPKKDSAGGPAKRRSKAHNPTSTEVPD